MARRRWVTAALVMALAVACVTIVSQRAERRREREQAVQLAARIEELLAEAPARAIDGSLEPTDAVFLRRRIAAAEERLDAHAFERARTEKSALLARVGAGWRALEEPLRALARLDEAERAIRLQRSRPTSWIEALLFPSTALDPRAIAIVREERANARLDRGDEEGALEDAASALAAWRDLAERDVAPTELLLGRSLIALGDQVGGEAFLREAARSAIGARQALFWTRSDALAELARIAGRRDGPDADVALRRDALAAARSAALDTDVRVARRKYELASVLHDFGPLAWDEARERYAESLATVSTHACGDLDSLASHLSNFALLEKQSGRLSAAEPLLARAIAMQQRLVSGDARGTATMLNNLGTLRGRLGDRRAAEEALLESLTMRRRLFPEGDRDVVQSLINLGSLHHDAHDFERAAELEREAVDTLRNIVDGDDRDLAIAIDNLGATLQDLGRYGESEELAREALAMLRRVARGPDPDLAQALDNLGTVLCRRNVLAEAEPLLVEALAMWRAVFRDGDVSVALTLRHLAWLHENQQDFARAEGEYQDALRVLDQGGASGSLRAQIEDDWTDCQRKRDTAARAK